MADPTDASNSPDAANTDYEDLRPGYSPPDKPLFIDEGDETIEDRIPMEVPDPNSAYGAPDNESGMDRDDPEILDDGEVGDASAGQLVAPDEGAHVDRTSEMVADAKPFRQDPATDDDSGVAAEDAAMHVIGVDDEDYAPE